jgi:hypothetical protein
MSCLRALALIVFLSVLHAAAAECTAQSGERRVPLLELYTSEGCDSCPPTDRWVSALPARGYGPDRVVVLAFHVDYWDRLGWPDRFAQARFSERQRAVNDRNGARVIYTPQLMLNGKDYRRSMLGDDLARQLAQLDGPKARLRLRATTAANRLSVNVVSETGAADAQTWIALFENALVTDVRAGENRGKRLQHDFVTRELKGPFAAGSATHSFTLDPSWNHENLGIAAFVSHARTGETLQALALPLCR